MKNVAGAVKKIPQQLSLFSQTSESGRFTLPARWGVFDLETIRSAYEVGGWNCADKMGMSVGVVYDSSINDYSFYLEPEVEKLIVHLHQLDLVIGFNNKRFDNQVLSGYGADDLHLLPNFDLLEEVKNKLGHRLKLDNLAGATLGEGKSGDGVDALRWYKEGKIDRIIQYCKKDVEVTKNLFLYALEKEKLLFTNKYGQVVQFTLQLERSLQAILEG